MSFLRLRYLQEGKRIKTFFVRIVLERTNARVKYFAKYDAVIDKRALHNQF